MKLSLRPIALLLLGLTAGCSSTEPPVRYVENVAVQCRFASVDQPEERERVYRIVKGYAAENSLEPKEVPATPNFDLSFTISRLALLDEMHVKLLYPERTDKQPLQAFNPKIPALFIRYDTLSIGAGIQVIVRFTVTPGAKLFYKPQGGTLTDITQMVDSTGNVSLTTRIAEGQRFFYAKAISGGVSKWLKINIFTQQVQEISEREFEEAR